MDAKSRSVVATPFPKFFNVGEGAQTIPDLPFETYEKLDGSLIIIFWHDGEWKTATKGSLNSDQSVWAKERLSKANLCALDPGTTYLCEAIYPANRIVVSYDYQGLVLLGAYDGSGEELDRDQLGDLADKVGWRIARAFGYATITDLLLIAKTLPLTEEGYVLRFSDGLRLKVKGDEYCRIHRLVSNLTPLSIWEAMLKQENMEAVRLQLPEEFWPDFDQIVSLLEEASAKLFARILEVARPTIGLTDKEVDCSLIAIRLMFAGLFFPIAKTRATSFPAARASYSTSSSARLRMCCLAIGHRHSSTGF